MHVPSGASGWKFVPLLKTDDKYLHLFVMNLEMCNTDAYNWLAITL